MPSTSSFDTKEGFNKWYSEYRKKPEWKKYHNEYNRAWRKKNGIFKDLVRKKVSRAIELGKMERGVCEVCKISNVEAHHDDYSKPLDVRWFCRIHHRKHDVETGKRKF